MNLPFYKNNIVIAFKKKITSKKIVKKKLLINVVTIKNKSRKKGENACQILMQYIIN